MEELSGVTATCDTSLSYKECEHAQDTAQETKKILERAAKVLRTIAAKDQSKLTQDEKNAVNLVKSRFGNRANTPDGLNRVAEGLEVRAELIGPVGSGTLLIRGDNKKVRGFVPTAYVLSSRGGIENKIYLNKAFLKGTDASTNMNTIAHEIGHVAGAHLDWYAGASIPDELSLDKRVAEDNRSAKKLYNFYVNADSFSCSVKEFQSGCQ